MSGKMKALLAAAKGKQVESSKEAAQPEQQKMTPLQRALAEQNKRREVQPSPEDKPKNQVKPIQLSTQALAELDTSDIEVVARRQQVLEQVTLKAPAFGPDDMKDRLAKLDELVMSDAGLNQITLDIARGYCKDIMVALKTEPELDSILIDKDIRNIMLFIRTTESSAVEAKETRVKKVTKTTEAKARKDKIKANLQAKNLLGNAVLGDLSSLGKE